MSTPTNAASTSSAAEAASSSATQVPANATAAGDAAATSNVAATAAPASATPSVPEGITLASTREELAAALGSHGATPASQRAVVMTMGALHQGHFDLVREALRRIGPGGELVLTIFVNPLQFAPGEDLDAYPRTLAADLEGLAATLAEYTAITGNPAPRAIAFAPTPQVMYPHGEPQIRLTPGPIATVLEGATRPTHFGGVLQVVLTLLNLAQPDIALFGRKDAQQLALITQMVRDLALPVEIVPVSIRREPDGLAMSSRNTYLSATERSQALALSRALVAGQEAAEAGASPAEVREAALASLSRAPGVEVDYVALIDPDTFEDLAAAGLGLPPTSLPDDAATAAHASGSDSVESGAAGGHADDSQRATSASHDASRAGVEHAAKQGLLALAARVGSTRLIDNALVMLR